MVNAAVKSNTISKNHVTMDYRPKPKNEPSIHSLIQNYRKESKDADPRLQICADLEGFVISMIQKDFGTYISQFDDLYEEGMAAILKKADRYDPTRGTKTSFFCREIKHAMMVWVSENVMMSSAYYAENEIHINRALRDQDNVESFTAEQIYDMLGGKLSVYQIKQVLKLKQERRDAKWYAIESGRWNDTPYPHNIPAYYQPENYTEQAVLGAQLRKALNTLDDDERELVSAYYGLDGVPVPAACLGRKYGVSQPTMMKRITNVVRKLRLEMTGSEEIEN